MFKVVYLNNFRNASSHLKIPSSVPRHRDKPILMFIPQDYIDAEFNPGPIIDGDLFINDYFEVRKKYKIAEHILFRNVNTSIFLRVPGAWYIARCRRQGGLIKYVRIYSYYRNHGCTGIVDIYDNKVDVYSMAVDLYKKYRN